MLENHHRIGIRQRGAQHAVRVGHRRRRDHFDARDMRIPGLEAMRVLSGELTPSTRRHAHHERNRELTSRHMMQRRGGIDDLIEGQQAEVDRHNFDDRSQAAQGGADSDTDET